MPARPSCEGCRVERCDVSDVSLMQMDCGGVQRGKGLNCELVLALGRQHDEEMWRCSEGCTAWGVMWVLALGGQHDDEMW